MDRISAVLILGILVMAALSGHIIYDTWLDKDGAKQRELIFNDDTSVTNESEGQLWIRARFSQNETDVAPDELEGSINEKSWLSGSDGWYYHISSIGPAQSTGPFAKPDIASNRKLQEQGGGFRIDVQAVDQAWLMERPEDCREAFVMFENIRRADEPIYL